MEYVKDLGRKKKPVLSKFIWKSDTTIFFLIYFVMVPFGRRQIKRRTDGKILILLMLLFCALAKSITRETNYKQTTKTKQTKNNTEIQKWSF